ncbi:hypothetical protein OXX80_013329, partial [Metschnikowia pulcherrima]
MPSPA